MFRAIPVPNKNCGRFFHEQDKKIHQKKMLQMKPFVDANPPNTFGLVNNRKKKEQQMEDRFTEIERENRILLEKITSIMQKNNRILYKDYKILKRTKIDNYMGKSSGNFYKKPSLNQNIRKRDLMKIAMENQEILKRIENKKSSYNIKLWQKNRELSEKYLANISEFPLKFSSEFDRKTMTSEHFRKRPNNSGYSQNSHKMTENESYFHCLMKNFIKF